MTVIPWATFDAIALPEYRDVVERVESILSPAGRMRKLRVYLLDGSFVDVWYSLKGDYSFHWERRFINGSLYRHDNAPHARWRYVPTFPKHFHNGREDNVESSFISDSPEEALRDFLDFVRGKLAEIARGA
ncbi:MAG: DUF6516 family protein [Anaerolineae bacterium]